MQPNLHESLQDICRLTWLYDQGSGSLYSYRNRAQLNGRLQGDISHQTKAPVHTSAIGKHASGWVSLPLPPIDACVAAPYGVP